MLTLQTTMTTKTTTPPEAREITLRNNRVCCIADLHIGIHQNSIFWHETALSWARWLGESLKNQDIEDIIILGDVYHYRDEIAVNTLHVVNEIFKIWKDFNIIILVGNHDSYYKDRSDINSLSLFDGWKNISIIAETLNTTILGKRCCFAPWGFNIDDIKSADIIFGHFEIESFKMNSYKLCDHGIKTDELLSKAPLIISGHFHLRDERIYNNKRIIYLGNPFEMDFGDTGTAKGYYILDFNNLKLDFTENTKSPRHKKMHLTDLITSNKFGAIVKEENDIKQIQSEICNNIVKLIINMKVTPDHVDTLLKKLSVYKPFSLSVDYSLTADSIHISDETNLDVSGVDISKAIEEFVNLLDIEDKPDIIRYSQELYKKYK